MEFDKRHILVKVVTSIPKDVKDYEKPVSPWMLPNLHLIKYPVQLCKISLINPYTLYCRYK